MIKRQLRKIKFFIIKLLRIKDNAHSVALGFTLGLLINFIPSFGLGPFLSTASAKIFRGNPIAGFLGGVSFLWAFPLLFYLNVLIGETIFPLEVVKIEEAVEDSDEAIEVGLQIGKAFFVGMLINLILFGLLCYFFTYTIFKKYRRNLLLYIHNKWDI